MKDPRLISRRRFLGQASCAAVSTLPVLSTLLNLKFASSIASAQAVPGSEYRALVCLFLNGGNDSFNMLAPRGAAEHAEYAAVRQDLAIPAANFLPINPLNSAQVGRQLGVHPGMPELAQLFFFVSLGGWDHHDEVLVNQANMLPVVSQAVGAFYHALDLLGIQNNVTLFLASDFGRTLSSNGRGSDHAWGGNTFVVGGAVDGKKIYGAYPDLYADNPLDVGRGRLIPTTSVDSYFAELALWLGVPRASLPLVLPNIGRFYDTAGSGAPVGFLPV